MARTRTGTYISEKDRFTIFLRDGFTCVYCGAGPPIAELSIDHVLPKCAGGNSFHSNLVTCCRDCNVGKHMRVLTGHDINTLRSRYGRYAQHFLLSVCGKAEKINA